MAGKSSRGNATAIPYRSHIADGDRLGHASAKATVDTDGRVFADEKTARGVDASTLARPRTD
jgi:hypothetical protein